MRFSAALACLGLLALCGGSLSVGCRRSLSDRLVPVAGRVTLDGGSWPNAGHLTFVLVSDAPVSELGGPVNASARVGFAEFDAGGRFVAQTRVPGDGLKPGRYRVGVSCWREPPDLARPGKGPIPPERFRDAATSPLVIDVEAAGTGALSIDVRR